jgi:hypothetical protein
VLTVELKFTVEKSTENLRSVILHNIHKRAAAASSGVHTNNRPWCFRIHFHTSLPYSFLESTKQLCPSQQGGRQRVDTMKEGRQLSARHFNTATLLQTETRFLT